MGHPKSVTRSAATGPSSVTMRLWALWLALGFPPILCAILWGRSYLYFDFFLRNSAPAAQIIPPFLAPYQKTQTSTSFGSAWGSIWLQRGLLRGTGFIPQWYSQPSKHATGRIAPNPHLYSTGSWIQRDVSGAFLGFGFARGTIDSWESTQTRVMINGSKVDGGALQPWNPRQSRYTVEGTFLKIPYWFIQAVVTLAPALVVGRLFNGWRQWHRGKCERCGYDLRASKDRCPECGTPIPEPSVSAPTPTEKNSGNQTNT